MNWVILELITVTKEVEFIHSFCHSFSNNHASDKLIGYDTAAAQSSSFCHSLKNIYSNYYVSNNIFNSGNIVMSKTDDSSCSHGIYILVKPDEYLKCTAL